MSACLSTCPPTPPPHLFPHTSTPHPPPTTECAGHIVDIRGDAFIARTFDNEDDFKRLDFTLSEVSSSAEWVKCAARIAERKRQAGGPSSEQFLRRMQQQQKSGE